MRKTRNNKPQPTHGFAGKWLLRCVAGWFVLSLVWLPCLTVNAEAVAPTPYEVIDAVNTMRAGQGLAALQTDPILMSIAQIHADYMASIGTTTHYGADGLRATDRATAAGYGDGQQVIVAENVASLSGSVDLETLIYEVWGDALHWNTMTKSTYQDIGVGVSVSGEMIYIALDAGWRTGVPLADTATPSASAEPGSEPTTQSYQVIPVQTVTPQSDGKVIHIVQEGQTLWSIATAYGLDVSVLANANGIDLESPGIYPGQDIYVPIAATATPDPSSAETTPTPSPTAKASKTKSTRTRIPTRTADPSTLTPLPSAKSSGIQLDALTQKIVIVLAIGLVGLLVVSFLPGKKKE